MCILNLLASFRGCIIVCLICWYRFVFSICLYCSRASICPLNCGKPCPIFSHVFPKPKIVNISVLEFFPEYRRASTVLKQAGTYFEGRGACRRSGQNLHWSLQKQSIFPGVPGTPSCAILAILAILAIHGVHVTPSLAIMATLATVRGTYAPYNAIKGLVQPSRTI